MRILLLFFFCFKLITASAVSYDIYSLRQLYYEAAAKEESAKKFLSVMEKLDDKSDPLLLCYKGMAYLIEAKYSYNPSTKLSSFSKGKIMLEKAIVSDPKNVEIRFMRFCVQTNAPYFLGYNNNISSDKLAIIKAWSPLSDLDLKEKIRKYMLTSNSCTANEKIIFK